MKSLLEAKSYRRVSWGKLAGVRPDGKKGEGEKRQQSFIRVLEDLVAVLDGRRIPVQFVDAAGMPYRLDHGCIAMAINAGVLKDETHTTPLDWIVSVDLDGGYRARKRD